MAALRSLAQLDKAIRIMGTVQLDTALTDREVKDLLAFLEVLTGTLPSTAAGATARP